MIKWIHYILDYKRLDKAYEQLSDELLKTNNNLYIMDKSLKEHKERLLERYGKEAIETYWNEKRPKELVTWRARDGVEIDVRCFCQVDGTVKTFKGTNDEIAGKCLRWVIENIKYELDNGEFWKYPYETLLTNVGDCEDGAFLLATMMEMSKIPYWRIRRNKGYVKGGYHAYVTYLRESDDKWVILDWCYWPNESIGLDNVWSKAEKYFSCDSSWNSKYGFKGLK